MKAVRTKAGIDPGVFYVSAAISILFIAWGVLFTENLASVAGAVLDYIIATFGWVFVLATIGFLAFAVFLGLSRYGKIRLGRDDERPEFRTSSWVAMMFSAGMGIGLMFFGVAEPLSHLAAPPNGAAKPGSVDAARVAMEYSYFHWALHPWALYAVVGLALAYFTYRKGMPNLISSAFYPILGERVKGPIGKGIDSLAIFATLFGTATSLGLGAVQINSGLNFVWGVPTSNGLAIAIIAVLTVGFVVSAASGVKRGVKWLSNTNMVLAIALLLFVLVVGPTVFIFDTLTQAIGGYLSSIVPLSFRTSAFGDREWLSTWTIFYWAWWISWAPFVGTFIARISRGRTIWQFILGVVLVPSAVSFVWFAILGGAALNLQLTGQANIAGAVAEAPEIGLFTTLGEFPLATLTSLVVIVLVALFFVSGADAASLVMGMLSSRGAPNPAKPVVILWGTLTGAAAAVLLLAGGLEALQQAAIIAAAPFVLVMIGLCYCLFKALSADQPGPAARAPTAVEPGGAPLVDPSQGAVARS